MENSVFENQMIFLYNILELYTWRQYGREEEHLIKRSQAIDYITVPLNTRPLNNSEEIRSTRTLQWVTTMQFREAFRRMTL
jgi:hypothetical protein